jgi:hypothetical protein
VANCQLPYPVPKLVCAVADEEGRTIGLIESCVAGMPLSQLKGDVNVPIAARNYR